MKMQKVESWFKRISEKSSNPKAGMKRENLIWEFEALESQDLESLSQDQVIQVLNGFIEGFGRKLIAAQGENWDFVPSGVSFTAAFADMVAERTSSRLVTKDSLQKLGEFYRVAATKYLGVSLPAALAGKGVIEGRFKAIAGKNDALGKMNERLLALCEAAPVEEVEPFAELIEALLKELEGLQEVTVLADML